MTDQRLYEVIIAKLKKDNKEIIAKLKKDNKELHGRLKEQLEFHRHIQNNRELSWQTQSKANDVVLVLHYVLTGERK
jgi:hypothetical protein